MPPVSEGFQDPEDAEGLQDPEDAEGEQQERKEDRRPKLIQNHQEKEGIGGLPFPKRESEKRKPQKIQIQKDED